ncbi:DegT/DnrJ/EryC1/StrS family aminotransferase [Sedimentisphaera salicampi]|uniref:DegT/DnrJ/EryC1/StrS family aminotransferase n=1 Tax=Sedimentisphaera salicampi TaxID=1941349 RepID=UPI000B9AEA46|nr:DegT/DnrJ/EryC1/StrS family aminotransferase [Sedimentisphaera salicampi]OXU15563.1 dTDP-3-amino-3,6-dideoxy-alpha-D-galactopyranose transaminase [Sedimentisphaera salicampi]
MNIQLLDLKAQYEELKDELTSAVLEVLESQRYIGGKKVEELEQKIADMSNSRFAVGASSGTDAILNTLMSLDIKEGDEVITTPFTFFSTAGCIARLGAKPVFVDIKYDTFNIDPVKIKPAISSRTKAIMPVHLFGQMAEMDAVMKIAEENDLYVIEDAAQAISATYKGNKAGSIGTAGCFSFFPSKNLGGIGDGGMVVTDDEKLYERLKIMRNHGSSPKYFHKYIGGNFRLDPIQAAALLVKLPYLDKWSEKRREHLDYYNQMFSGYPEILVPTINDYCVSVVNQYVIRVKRRDELKEYLRKNGVGTEVYYPKPLHLQECFKYLGYQNEDLPVSEQAAKEVLALPIYPEMTEEMLTYVAEHVVNFVKNN